MRFKKEIILVIVVSFIILGTVLVFGQDSLGDKPYENIVIMPERVEPKLGWIWGEVIAIDEEKRVFLISYFDYDTEKERELKFYVNRETSYDGLRSLGDLMAEDTVSIDYIVKSGKNLIRNLVLEKIEEVPLPDKLVLDPEGYKPYRIKLQRPVPAEE